MNKFNLETLLDIDDLSLDQEKFLKSLVSYSVSKTGSSSYSLTFSLKDNPTDTFGYYVDSKLLDLKAFKYIMYHIIEAKCWIVNDLEFIDSMKKLLTSNIIENSAYYGYRDLIIGDEEFSMGDELNIRAQQLYKVIEIFKGLKLV